MNILFLDIDGVLKSNRSSIAYNETNMMHNSLAGSCVYKIEFKKESFNLDPICLQYLKNIVNRYNFKIVISSTWRAHSCLDHFHQMFDLYDWDTRDIVIGFTPISREAMRGEDIAQWITNNPKIIVDNYIILDDNDDFHVNQKSQFVKTNIEIGLTYTDIEKIEKIMESSQRN